MHSIKKVIGGSLIVALLVCAIGGCISHTAQTSATDHATDHATNQTKLAIANKTKQVNESKQINQTIGKNATEQVKGLSSTQIDMLNYGRYVILLAANYGGREDMPTIETADVLIKHLSAAYNIPEPLFFETGHVVFVS